MQMMEDTSSTKPLNILSGFASLLSLLGIISFFSGWIYRWAYFNYFNLDITRLNYPPQSFLLVPLQLFLGRPENILKISIILIILPIIIYLNLELLNIISISIKHQLITLLNRIQSAWLKKALWRMLLSPDPAYREGLNRYASLIRELVIVSWVVGVVFWFSQHQGFADARKDAVNATSSLPVVTFVGRQEDFILGTDLRIIDDNGVPPDPQLMNSVIVGDLGLAKLVRQKSLNDVCVDRVWHFLTERDDWVYIFFTLKAKESSETQPIVVTFPKAEGDQLIILSPSVPASTLSDDTSNQKEC